MLARSNIFTAASSPNEMKGVGVLLVSSELDEIMGLADRIAVIYAGEILAMMPASEATKERLGVVDGGSAGGARRGSTSPSDSAP